MGAPGFSKASATRRRIGGCLPDWRRYRQYLIDNFSPHLTRRANHRHIFIIARIQSPRRGNPAAGFFNPDFLNRTAAARHGATSSHAPLPETSQAGRRPNPFLNFARTRERAGTRRGETHGRTRSPLDGDKVRARNDRMKRSCRTFISYRAGDPHDRISDRARPGGPRRHCRVGGVPVSVVIMQFMKPKGIRIEDG